MVCTCYTALPTHLAELWASIKLRSCFGAFYGSYVGLQHEAHVHDAQAEVPFLLWSCWPLLLVCLTFIVWQNPNAWYVACYIKSNPINQGRSNRETVAKYLIVSLLALFSRGICSTYYHLYVLMPWRVKMLIIMMWRKKLPLNLLLSLQCLDSNEIEIPWGFFTFSYMYLSSCALIKISACQHVVKRDHIWIKIHRPWSINLGMKCLILSFFLLIHLCDFFAEALKLAFFICLFAVTILFHHDL